MVRPPAVAALLLLFGEAAAETAAESAARLDPRSHVITNASQVLNYEIEGVSLNTAPGLTESILAGRGYRRVYPAEPPKVGHTQFIYVKGNAISAGAAGSTPAYSGNGGSGFEVLITLSPYRSWMDWPIHKEKLYIAQLRYRRLPPLSEAGLRGNVRVFSPSGPLPDTPDRQILTDLKAWLCARMSDVALRARHCARTPDDQLEVKLDVRDGTHGVVITLRSVRGKSELVLSHSPV